jgi:hypothetical protein
MAITMNREEFLRQFREALEGKVSEQVINENAAYYRNYINNQVNSGKSESGVLHELGDPRLLAKTIEESSRFSGGRESAQRSYSGSYGNATDYRQETYSNDMQRTDRKVTTIPAWVVALVGIIIVVLVVTVVFNVFMFFLPAILVGLVVLFVYRWIQSILK